MILTHLQIEIAMVVAAATFIGLLVAAIFVKKPWIRWLIAAAVVVNLGLSLAQMESSHDRQQRTAEIQSKLDSIKARITVLKTRVDANNAEVQTLIQEISDPKPPLSAAIDQARRDRLASLMKEKTVLAKESEAIQKDLSEAQQEIDKNKQ